MTQFCDQITWSFLSKFYLRSIGLSKKNWHDFAEIWFIHSLSFQCSNSVHHRELPVYSSLFQSHLMNQNKKQFLQFPSNLSAWNLSSGSISLYSIYWCTVYLLLQWTVLTAFKSVKHHLHTTPSRWYSSTKTRKTFFLCRNSVRQNWAPWGNTEDRIG